MRFLIGAMVVWLMMSGAAMAGGTIERTYGEGYAGPIPDNDAVGYLSPIVVPDSFPIETVQIHIFGLAHNYCSDLTIELRHAGVSTPTTLCTNIRFGNSADFDGDYTFSDSGADIWVVTDGLTGTDDVPPGAYRASGEGGAVVTLNTKYFGEDAEGPWTLRIYDDDFLVAGEFTGWSITFGGAPACVPSDFSGDLDGDGEIGAMDLAELIGNWGLSCPE